MMKRLLCLFGKHQRSGGRAYEDADGVFRSVCRHCGCAMSRDDATRRWAPERRTEAIIRARANAEAARQQRKARRRRSGT